MSENWACFRWGFNFLACSSGLLMTRPGRWWPHSHDCSALCVLCCFQAGCTGIIPSFQSFLLVIHLRLCLPHCHEVFFITYFESSKIKKLHFQGIVPKISQPFWLPHSFCTYLYSFLCLFHVKIIVKYLVCAGSWEGEGTKGSVFFCCCWSIIALRPSVSFSCTTTMNQLCVYTYTLSLGPPSHPPILCYATHVLYPSKSEYSGLWFHPAI